MRSISWQTGQFKIKTTNGTELVSGLVGGPFGLRHEPRHWRPVWTVTHLASGMRLTLGGGAGFHDLALAKQFVERLLPLADWSGTGAFADDESLAVQAVAIWNDLIARDVATTNAQIIASYRQPQSVLRVLRRENR